MSRGGTLNIWVGSGGQEVGRRIIKEGSRWSDGRRKVRWSESRRMQRIGRPDGGRRLAEAIPVGSSREGGDDVHWKTAKRNGIHTNRFNLCFYFIFKLFGCLLVLVAGQQRSSAETQLPANRRTRESPETPEILLSNSMQTYSS